MKQRLTPITLTALLALTVFSTGAMAGGYDRNVAYAGSVGVHRYAFQPDPDLARKLNPTRAEIPEKVEPAERPTTKGLAASYTVGSRVYYRQSTEGKGSRVRGLDTAVSSKLGTAFPETFFNRNRGKGRELSRIFKP